MTEETQEPENSEEFDYSQLSGAGLDSVGTEDLGLPMLMLINKNSAIIDPEHRKHEEKKIEGAQVGDILFSRTRTIIPQPVEIIPIRLLHCYALWRPRKEGGGLLGHVPMDIVAHENYRKHTNEEGKMKEYFNGLEAIETRYLFVYFKQEEGWTFAIIPFTSSNHKTARSLIQRIAGFTQYPENTPEAEIIKKPPFFARSFQLSTKLERNDEYSWREYALVGEPRILTLAQDADALQACHMQNHALTEAPVLQLQSTEQALALSSDETIQGCDKGEAF